MQQAAAGDHRQPPAAWVLTMRLLASLLNPCQVNNDVTLSAAHNLANNALKTGITYNTTVRAAARQLTFLK